MKPICIYTFKLFIAFLTFFTGVSFEASSQNEDLIEEEDIIIHEETTEEPATSDTVQFSYKENPFGIQIGIDLIKLATFAIDAETKYEGQVGISYKNVHLIAEAGYALYAYDLAYKNSDDYEVEGEYYRLGIDYAFNLGLQNQLLVGIRYGKSKFGDRGSFEVHSDLWENYTESLDSEERDNSTASWGEAIIGTQTLVTKNLYFGWYFRLRKLIDRTSYEPIDIYYIPGYGKSVSQSVPALNLFLKYKLSF